MKLPDAGFQMKKRMRERLTEKRGWNKASAASVQSYNLPQGETANSHNWVWRWDPPKACSHNAKRRNKNTACILVVKNTLIACSITAVELARWGFCVSCDDGSLFFLKVSTYFKKFSQNPMKQQCSIWYLDLVFGLISVWTMMFFFSDKEIFQGKTQTVGSRTAFEVQRAVQMTHAFHRVHENNILLCRLRSHSSSDFT